MVFDTKLPPMINLLELSRTLGCLYRSNSDLQIHSVNGLRVRWRNQEAHARKGVDSAVSRIHVPFCIVAVGLQGDLLTSGNRGLEFQIQCLRIHRAKKKDM